jgi:uncharacterized membrane protein YheB (UPF0754 family)
LQDLLDKNNEKITNDETQTIQNFISSFNLKKINHVETYCNTSLLNKNLPNLTDRFISKEKFEQIFTQLLDLYGLDGWKISIENV